MIQKIVLLFFLCLLLPHRSNAQRALSETEKLASLCQLWGFLKYHHPTVVKGKYDWDKQLLSHIDTVINAKSKEELSNIYLSWIGSLGHVEKRHVSKVFSNDMLINRNSQWISDKRYFTDTLTTILTNIQNAKRKRRGHYARINIDKSPTLHHEHKYAELIYPASKLRLLCLFRYWNIIAYYYPCKYATTIPWDSSLTALIPQFRHAKDTAQYCRAMIKMIAAINDSHAEFITPPIFMSVSKQKLAPYKYTITQNKLIISGYYDYHLAKKGNLRIGDIVTAINDRPVADCITDDLQYASGSNERVRLSRTQILFGWADSSSVTIERNGSEMKKVLYRYPYSTYKFEKLQTKKSGAINKRITYINLRHVNKKEFKKLVNATKDSCSLIIDCRDGGNNASKAMARKLLDKKYKFIRFSTSVPAHPGVIQYKEIHVAGRKNKHYFKGKVYLLINEKTQSAAEYACMMFRKSPNAICTGTNTAAADGPVCYVDLPGGYNTRFSTKGVYTPEGHSLVGTGILPDIFVAPTIAGLVASRDEILEYAIELGQRQ